MARKRNQTRFGTKAEQKVAQQLRRSGANVKRSPGSKGAADLQANFETKKWVVQVKSTRGNDAAELTPAERQRLNQVATKRNATPVVAQVTTGGTTYKSARDGRTLKPKA